MSKYIKKNFFIANHLKYLWNLQSREIEHLHLFYLDFQVSISFDEKQMINNLRFIQEDKDLIF